MWLRKQRTAARAPDAIPVSAKAATKLRELKKMRPLSPEENACVAALAWQLGVPDGWRFDGEAMCFRPPEDG